MKKYRENFIDLNIARKQKYSMNSKNYSEVENVWGTVQQKKREKVENIG